MHSCSLRRRGVSRAREGEQTTAYIYKDGVRPFHLFNNEPACNDFRERCQDLSVGFQHPRKPTKACSGKKAGLVLSKEITNSCVERWVKGSLSCNT